MGPFLTLVILSFFESVEVIRFAIPSSAPDGVGFHKENALPHVATSLSNIEKCDPSGIPVMDEFDVQKFSGVWYELAKTTSGYIDANDSVWKITTSENPKGKVKFMFSGRDNYDHCIRPISGILHSSDKNPGALTLKYRTYSTYVSENVRVLYTDYVSVAVLYACAHTNSQTNTCHPAGLFGNIWTRQSHVDAKVFENAAKILQKACISKPTLRIRTLRGPCKIEDLGSRDEDSYPVPNFCYHVMDPGSCQANFKRFYFDNSAKECKEFVFSGCGGNDNNFMQKRECENQCIGFSTSPSCDKEAPCALSCPPCCNEDGNGCVRCSCSSVVIDPPFIDHCLSNPNECSKECKPEKVRDGCYHCICEGDFITDEDSKNERPSVCYEVKEKGVCGNVLKRFYYNAISGDCEKFNYTGCGGNKNNFLTFVSCAMKCKDVNLSAGKNVIIRDDGEPDSGSRFECLFHLLVLVIVLNWLS